MTLAYALGETLDTGTLGVVLVLLASGAMLLTGVFYCGRTGADTWLRIPRGRKNQERNRQHGYGAGGAWQSMGRIERTGSL